MALTLSSPTSQPCWTSHDRSSPAFTGDLSCVRAIRLDLDVWGQTQGRVAGGSFTLRLPQIPA